MSVGGDIEDIELDNCEQSYEEMPNIRINHHTQPVDVSSIDVSSDTIIPECHKLWIMTFGCAHNFADGEYMKGILLDYGYPFVENREEAELWILNSCTVKDPSETAFHNLVVEAEKKNKKVVLAGCVPQADADASWIKSLSILGVKQVHRILEVVEETLKGNKIQLLSLKGLPPLNLPKVRRDPFIEIVPISEVCLGHCTYCKTRFARGRLMSYPIDMICDRVSLAFKDGVYEIWLSSEDTGAYGLDKQLTIVDLLQSVMSIIPEGSTTMLRLGMTNPPYILQHLPEIATFLRNPNVYAFIHIPVQSGSNAVLEAMQRQYKAEDFCVIADYLLKAVPGLTIATDIIVGFATETEENHQETMALLKKYCLAIVNISKFFPRPGTPAARLKHIPSTVVKPRSAELSLWFKGLDPYRSLLNQLELVWIGSETSDHYMVAHTKAYIKVLIEEDNELRGKRVVVRITEISRFHVIGEIIDRNPGFIKECLSPSEIRDYLQSIYNYLCLLQTKIILFLIIEQTKQKPTFSSNDVTEAAVALHNTTLIRSYGLYQEKGPVLVSFSIFSCNAFGNS